MTLPMILRGRTLGRAQGGCPVSAPHGVSSRGCAGAGDIHNGLSQVGQLVLAVSREPQTTSLLSFFPPPPACTPSPILTLVPASRKLGLCPQASMSSPAHDRGAAKLCVKAFQAGLGHTGFSCSPLSSILSEGGVFPRS